MITGEQVTKARALLEWSIVTLARWAKVGPKAILEFELGEERLDERDLAQIKETLEAASVEFTITNGGEPGVKLKAKARTIDADKLNASNDE